jgi:hypothetical protein
VRVKNRGLVEGDLTESKRERGAKLQSSYCKDNHFSALSSACVQILVFKDVGLVSLRTLEVEHRMDFSKRCMLYLCASFLVKISVIRSGKLKMW